MEHLHKGQEQAREHPTLFLWESIMECCSSSTQIYQQAHDPWEPDTGLPWQLAYAHGYHHNWAHAGT